MNAFFSMLSFLTRIPVPKKQYNENDFINGLYFMPWIGLIIGVFLMFFVAIFQNISMNITAVGTMFLYCLITGGIHLDGLADSADGYLSNRSVEKSLEIMKDSRIGAFGVMALIFILLGDIACIIEFNRVYWFLLFPMVGRFIGLLMAFIFQYGREDGMGKIVVENVNAQMIISSAIGVIGLNFILLDFSGVFATVGSIFFIFLIVHRISKKFGGITGDTIGMAIELGQFLYLFLALTYWMIF